MTGWFALELTFLAPSLYSASTPRIPSRRTAMTSLTFRRPKIVVFTCVLALAMLSPFASAQIRFPKLTPQVSGTTEGLIAVSPVSAKVVWASGRHGTFLVTSDGGATWKSGQVPGARWLQFRGVRGVSATTAYLLSIGNNPGNFRIYKTEDGGSTWAMQFRNELAGAFYDCFAFWSPKRGIAHSDSVNGVFPDIRSEDGATWQSIADNMPPALDGEFSFSSSDTCVATQGENNAWIATGGGPIARILATVDGGDTDCVRHADCEFAERGRVYSRFPRCDERSCGRW